MRAILAILAAVLCCTHGTPLKRKIKKEHVNLLMPNVQPKVKDTYLCFAMKTNATPTYIVGFTPHANMDIAHHILLYGCKNPGVRNTKDVWNCGEMAQTKSDYTSAGVCESGQQIIYAWAMDAPALHLPKDVGFKVGGSTDIDYLVMQVHYKDVSTFLDGGKDRSGITMVTTEHPMPKRAGVYLLATSGSIPAHSVEYMEAACPVQTDLVIHPFAFRTHAHKLGQVVSGYRIRDGKWTEIGRKSPQKPQMFYNITNPGMEIRNNDILAARCTMKNDLDRTVNIGATQNDEMCNFYMMYYVDGNRIYDRNSCFSAGAPFYFWEKSPYARNMNLRHRPKSVSTVPGKKTPITKRIGKNIMQDDVMVDKTREIGNSDDFARLLQALDSAYDSEYKFYDGPL